MCVIISRDVISVHHWQLLLDFFLDDLGLAILGGEQHCWLVPQRTDNSTIKKFSSLLILFDLHTSISRTSEYFT